MKIIDAVTAADNRLLNFFTQICHKFQKLTGKNNFFLAKFFAYLAAVSTLIEVTNYYYPILSTPTSLFNCVVRIAFTLIFLALAYQCDKTEKDSLSDVKSKNMVLDLVSENRRFYLIFSLGTVVVKLSLISHYIFSLPQLIFDLYFIFVCILCYLVSIEPLPPAKSKIKKWIENINLLERKEVLVTNK